MPESESAKLVMAIMVMIFIVVMLAMVIRTDRKNRTTRTSETGTTDLTSKFDFLCKAAFAILVMFGLSPAYSGTEPPTKPNTIRCWFGEQHPGTGGK